MSGPVNMLLVEDNAGDVFIVKEVLEDLRLEVNLRVAGNGEEAMQLLRNDGFFPDVVILDLNLPVKSGQESWPKCRPIQNCAK